MTNVGAQNYQVGEEGWQRRRRRRYCPYLQMTLELHFQYISLSSMVRKLAGNGRESGSGLQLLRDVYSVFPSRPTGARLSL